MNAVIDAVNKLSVRWWDWVVPASWQSALVAVAIFALIWAGRRWPSPLRHGLLIVALLKFAMPPLLSLPVGLFTVAGPVWAAPRTPPREIFSAPGFSDSRQREYQ